MTADRTDPNADEQPHEGATTERVNPNFIDNDVDRVPETSFDDYGLDERLVDALAAKGITHPFPIQELTLPVALTGQDIIGQARTGTGKTLAFGLPLIHRLDPDAPHTQALIVTPTRELCIQVYEELRICEAMGYTSTTVYGGVGYDEQIEALEGGVDIVVGTPGRLLDMLGRGILDISKVGCVILDEADEMLDMGFLPDVERLLAAANEDGRHTMLFSATMPASVVKLARRYTDSPLFMGADSVAHETAPTVDQHFFQVFRMDKPRVLARVLQQPDRGNAMVFTRTKAMADRLVRELGDLGVDAIAIHGDLRQAAREKNLTRFRDGRTTVLCATEVAARGIDVDNVTHVVNYDIPDDEKMYLHRIGRTARAGASGVAITFAEHSELARLEMIRKAVDEQGEVPEVFSTSDLLTELFDLPDETPWGHLSTTGGGASGGNGSRGGSRSGSRGDRSGRGGGRGRSGGGSDDGRSRRSNQPSRERNRVEHDSGDDDGRDRRRSRTVLRDDAGDGGATREPDRRESQGPGGGDGSDRRGRRSRDRAAGDTGRDSSGADARSARDAAASRDRGERSGSSTSGRSSSGSSRTRGGARVRARGGKPVSDDDDRRGSDTSDRAPRTGASGRRSRTGGSSSAGRSSGGSPSGSGQRDSSGGSSSGSGRRSRSGGSSSGGGQRDRSSGSSSGGGRRDRSSGSSSGGGQRNRSSGSSSGSGQRNRSSGSSSGSGQRNRSSGSSSGSGQRNRSGGGRGGKRGSGQGGKRGAKGDDRAGRVELPSKVRPTEAGPAARGEGQPRHARRVQIDELA